VKTPFGGSAGLRERLDLLLQTAHTRLELLGLELQEEKLRLARLLLGTVLAAVLLGFAVVFALIWLTVALWDTHRQLGLGLATLITLALGLGAAGVAARAWAAGSGLFAASLAELERDRAALEQRRVP
jgi:uncharacterized membrane protein YqjE